MTKRFLLPEIAGVGSSRQVEHRTDAAKLSLGATVDLFVAAMADCDQVLLRIITHVTAELFVVNLEVLPRATVLTPPGVAFENLQA